MWHGAECLVRGFVSGCVKGADDRTHPESLCGWRPGQHVWPSTCMCIALPVLFMCGSSRETT